MFLARLHSSIFVLFASLLPTRCFAQLDDDSPRMTLLVKVIQRAEPSVVALFIENKTTQSLGAGSGTIIHPDGYVLTNDHALIGEEA